MNDCKIVCRLIVYLAVIIAVSFVLQLVGFLLLTRDGDPFSSDIEQLRWLMYSIGVVAAVSVVVLFWHRRKRSNQRLQLKGDDRE